MALLKLKVRFVRQRQNKKGCNTVNCLAVPSVKSHVVIVSEIFYFDFKA